MLAQTAQVLGKDEEAQEYSALYRQIQDAYVKAFVGSDGRINPEKQASYVRALAFELLPQRLRELATQRLVELIQRAGTHLGTGFLSTPFLLHVLSSEGYLDVAYALLKQETPPSWLYAVKQGATAIWEFWDAIDEEGNVHGSLNHCAYYASLYGEIASSWQIEHEQFTLTVTVPANTTATICIPARIGREVTEAGQAPETSKGVIEVKQEPAGTYIEVGSGTYTFTSRLAAATEVT